MSAVICDACIGARAGLAPARRRALRARASACSNSHVDALRVGAPALRSRRLVTFTDRCARASRGSRSARSSCAGAGACISMRRLQAGVAAGLALAALGLGTRLAATSEHRSSLCSVEAGAHAVAVAMPRSSSEDALLRLVRPAVRRFAPRRSVAISIPGGYVLGAISAPYSAYGRRASRAAWASLATSCGDSALRPWSDYSASGRPDAQSGRRVLARADHSGGLRRRSSLTRMDEAAVVIGDAPPRTRRARRAADDFETATEQTHRCAPPALGRSPAYRRWRRHARGRGPAPRMNRASTSTAGTRRIRHSRGSQSTGCGRRSMRPLSET